MIKSRAKPSSLRVLGIDPGTRVLGFGLIAARGGDMRALEYGVLRGGRGELPGRLERIFAGLEAVLRRTRPDRIAIERVFIDKDPRAAIALGEGRGVALLAAARCGAEIVEITPAEAKKSVAGHGAATKAQVQRMVQLQLGLARPPAPADASDALALAICAAMRRAAGPNCEISQFGISPAVRRAGALPPDILRRAFAKARR